MLGLLGMEEQACVEEKARREAERGGWSHPDQPYVEHQNCFSPVSTLNSLALHLPTDSQRDRASCKLQTENKSCGENLETVPAVDLQLSA